MKERIPQRIDHYRYTDKGVILEGVITKEEAKKDLPRLHDYIIKSASDISYYLAFSIDEVKNRVVNGHVEAQVMLQCQRCMENYTSALQCDISIAFVHNDFEQKQAENSCYDVFWLEKKELFDPRILIEDELLLAMPQIPMHPESEIGSACCIQLDYPVEDSSNEQDNIVQDNGQKDDNNPFAVLKKLKK